MEGSSSLVSRYHIPLAAKGVPSGLVASYTGRQELILPGSGGRFISCQIVGRIHIQGVAVTGVLVAQVHHDVLVKALRCSQIDANLRRGRGIKADWRVNTFQPGSIAGRAGYCLVIAGGPHGIVQGSGVTGLQRDLVDIVLFSHGVVPGIVVLYGGVAVVSTRLHLHGSCVVVQGAQGGLHSQVTGTGPGSGQQGTVLYGSGWTVHYKGNLRCVGCRKDRRTPKAKK